MVWIEDMEHLWSFAKDGDKLDDLRKVEHVSLCDGEPDARSHVLQQCAKTALVERVEVDGVRRREVFFGKLVAHLLGKQMMGTVDTLKVVLAIEFRAGFPMFMIGDQVIQRGHR